MATGNQVHAARILAGLTREALAGLAGIAPAALAELEAKGAAELDGPRAEPLLAALAAAGVEFLDGQAPGVRFRATTGESVPVECLTTGNDF